ncbi:MAG: 30S ribosomal protein S3 [bacterium]
MGQKVNPIGIRIGFNKGWNAHWFSQRNYAANLQEDSIIRELIQKRHPKSGISQIEIFRSRGEVVVSVHTAKPGIIIGRSGSGVQDLKLKLEKAAFSRMLHKERPTLRLNIVELKSPELNAQVVADNIAGQLERRISVKRAIKQSIERTMEKKAKGIKIRVAGRLGGSEIARSENISQGSIPLQTIRSDISYAQAEAHTTYGIIGIKVWIYLGQSDVFPVATSARTSNPNR